jgi:predicted NBD/HSP70 family sugar kinase
MNGRAGAELTQDKAGPEPVGGLRGSNQSGMRAHNERLVLSLLRQHGAMAKTDIARLSGLSAQTISVIMRALEQDGFLTRGEPQRGRIGQPSVPMSLNAGGAYFLGLKIGRRSADLTLIDFLGQVVGTRRWIYRYPTPDQVVRFVTEALPALLSLLPPAARERVGGMGIAMPFQLWAWIDHIHAPQSDMDQWRTRDIGAELAVIAQMPVTIQNDATAACGAELVFGKGDRPSDFLYFYFGYFIGGGLVLNNRLFTGKTGNAAGVGPMPVPGPDGRMTRLIELASMYRLAEAMDAAGEYSAALWEEPDYWRVSSGVLRGWLEESSTGLASAILSAATLIEIDTVMIDGWMPRDVRAMMVAETTRALHRLDLSGVTPPLIREGTVGPTARALGAAAVPLSQRYLLDPASSQIEV